MTRSAGNFPALKTLELERSVLVHDPHLFDAQAINIVRYNAEELETPFGVERSHDDEKEQEYTSDEDENEEQ